MNQSLDQSLCPPSQAAESRRLRNIIIAANIAGWAAIIVVIRLIFF